MGVKTEVKLMWSACRKNLGQISSTALNIRLFLLNKCAINPRLLVCKNHVLSDRETVVDRSKN